MLNCCHIPTHFSSSSEAFLPNMMSEKKPSRSAQMWILKCKKKNKQPNQSQKQSETICRTRPTRCGHFEPFSSVASQEDEPISLYSAIKPQNLPFSAGGNKYHHNRFVFQRRGSGALQLTGNDKYLHAGPREGQTAAAPSCQTQSWSDEASPFTERRRRGAVCLLKMLWLCLILFSLCC